MSSRNDFPRYPKPDAVTRIPEYGHAVIESSAGTGKTHTIEHLVIDLLVNRGLAIDEILVVTFTEKAAAELKRRIRAKLRELVALQATTTHLSPDNCWVVDDDAQKRLDRALVEFGSASVSTIHAFCHAVLAENAFLNGRLFDEQPVEERTAFSRAFTDVLRSELARRADLVPFLSAWLEVRQGTVDSLESLLYEVWRARAPTTAGFHPDRLAAVAGGLGETTRVSWSADQLAAAGVARGSIGKVLRNLEALTAALAEYRQSRDVAALLAELDQVELRYLSGKLDGFDELVDAAPSLSAVVAAKFLPLVGEHLTRMKREQGLYDFDDLLSRVVESLEGPRGVELARVLQSRYRAVLIDEFQDTDELQWRIFEKLFFVGGAKTPLTLVGDPKQSIYAFRGADVHVYLAARTTLVSRSAMVPLVENFRSTPELVEALNLVFDQKAEDPYFTGNVRYDRPVRAALDIALTTAEGAPAFPVVLLRAENKRSLPAHIAREIEALLTDSNRQLRLGPEGAENIVGPDDIFVLTRTRNEAEEIGDALAELGVPFSFYKQEGLFQTREAEEIRDLLAALVDFRNQSKRLRAWMTRFFGISLRGLERCGEVPPDHPLMRRLVEWKGLADANELEPLFTSILEESGVLRRELFSGRGERVAVNYAQLFETLLEEVHESDVTLSELVQTLSRFIDGTGLAPGSERNLMRLESEGRVQIMTIHMSKGLEAGIVFIYGFAGARPRSVHTYYQSGEKKAYVGKLAEAPPAIRDAIDRERREEDQRLFYVALTRARARLYLPLVPDETAGLGCYAQVNRRLHELIGVFKIEDVAAEHGVSLDRHVSSAKGWEPPPDLLRPQDNDLVFDALRDRHRGHVLTSYTRLKRLRGSRRAPPVSFEDRPDGTETALPEGSIYGTFLHDVLERVDFATLGENRELESWRRRDDVQDLFRRAMRTHGIDPRFRAEAERLVHTTLTCPVILGKHRIERGFASLATELREVEFVYPYPESDGTLRRGYATGFVDFVFELDGLTFFCDWKSDVLPGWDGNTLNGHVRANYGLQAKLYTLALLKMLGAETEDDYPTRFGGIVYCFLRGLPGGGLYFARPSWPTIASWRDELIREERL